MTLTAVLFVGGESRRMGADKAALMFTGEWLWARQLRTLRELNPEKIFISARTKPAWVPPEIEMVLDAPPSRGPLSGLAAALKNLRTTHLLALAVDLPGMTANHLEKLWALARPGSGMIPQNGTLFEPLCAVYPAEAATVAAGALADDKLSLQFFVQNLLRRNQAQIYHPAGAERGLYRNVNTPADLPPMSNE